jgi:putative phosphoesterase
MRAAVFSDVHSNLPALEAVLEDALGQSVDFMVCCGDLVGYGPFPNEVIDAVREIPTVMGNYDEGVGFGLDDCGCAFTNAEEEAMGRRSLDWTKKRMSDVNKAFLRGLPREFRRSVDGREVLFVHGSPRRINEYLYEDRPESSVVRMLEPLGVDCLVIGHTHIPYHRVVGSFHVVNVGSVGKQKDGDPRARYALIDFDGGVSVEFRKVSYPVEDTIGALMDSGLPMELVEIFRTGRKTQPL